MATSRFELKYAISYSKYLRFKNGLKGYTTLDRHSQGQKNHCYLVRSLYFDTFCYQAYQDKIYGEPQRRKLRLRCYSTAPQLGSKISVELKVRKYGQIEKHSTFANLEEYKHFMETKTWPRQHEVLDEFERILRLKQERPKTLVDYEREAYFAKHDPSVRITFDHSVRAAKTTELFPDSKKIFFRKLHPCIILEIKCAQYVPEWLQKLTTGQELKMGPNSKYAQAVEVSQF